MSTPHIIQGGNNESVWILVGVAVGAITGLVFGDVGFGVSIGMMVGAVVTMTLERRRKKKNYSAILIGVSIAAVVFIIAFRIVEAL